MANCLSHSNLDSMEKKMQEFFFRQVKNYKIHMGPNLFLFLFLSLSNNSFQGDFPQYNSTQLDYNV